MIDDQTKLLYLDDSYLFENTAVIQNVDIDDQKCTVTLDQTVFYPKGGGQPSDIGEIHDLEDKCLFKVQNVQNINGIVRHQGNKIGNLVVGEKVKLLVDKETRILHSRIHSAGHLLDHAGDSLGLPLLADKGYHFPEGPNVEYRLDGTLDTSPAALVELKQKWEAEAIKIIGGDKKISIKYADRKDVPDSLLGEIASKIKDPTIRMIYFDGENDPRPCCGTHVQRTSEIGNFAIRKVSFKAGILKVAYRVF